MQNLCEERKKLKSHVVDVNETKMKTIAEFQKAYEVSYCRCYSAFLCFFILWKQLTSKGYDLQEQSKSDAEKLIADISSLVTSHISRQKEMVYFFRSLKKYINFLGFIALL